MADRTDPTITTDPTIDPITDRIITIARIIITDLVPADLITIIDQVLADRRMTVPDHLVTVAPDRLPQSSTVHAQVPDPLETVQGHPIAVVPDHQQQRSLIAVLVRDLRASVRQHRVTAVVPDHLQLRNQTDVRLQIIQQQQYVRVVAVLLRLLKDRAV